MYNPGLPKGQHKLLLVLASFDGTPDAYEMAEAAGFKFTTCRSYLATMERSGLVNVERAEEEFGERLAFYSLTDEGNALFEQIIEATEAIKRLAGLRRSAQRMIARRRRQRQ